MTITITVNFETQALPFADTFVVIIDFTISAEKIKTIKTQVLVPLSILSSIREIKLLKESPNLP
jgi:hypothetical protein